MTPSDFARKLGVDPKTVDRWIGNSTRNPYLRIAYQAAQILDVDVTYLWPTIFDSSASKIAGTDELVACWPGRAAVPVNLWARLFTNAQRRIVVMGDLALSDLIPNLSRLLVDKVSQGVHVRIIVVDPDTATSPIDKARAIQAEAAYLPLVEQGISVSRYPGVLSTTILQVDDDLIVRTGIDGCPAAFAPVIQVRCASNGPLSRLYLTSLDSITETAMPVLPPTNARAVA